MMHSPVLFHYLVPPFQWFSMVLSFKRVGLVKHLIDLRSWWPVGMESAIQGLNEKTMVLVTLYQPGIHIVVELLFQSYRYRFSTI